MRRISKKEWFGYFYFFLIFVLPWILVIWFPELLAFALFGTFGLLVVVACGYYELLRKKIDDGGRASRIDNYIVKFAGFMGALVEVLGDVAASIFGVIVVILILGGLIGVLVFGWRQLL
jgi:hypothetical protein